MNMKNTDPIITVCIPLFQTELYLTKCLRSVLMQDFDDFEVFIVSDASDGKDEKGHRAKKIINITKKECNHWRKKNGLKPVTVRFREHQENRGLIEVRRTLFLEAKGKFVTQVDSDDEMEPGALKALYSAAKESGADIVHGTSTAGTYDSEDNFIPQEFNRNGKIFYGIVEGRQIFHTWLIDNSFTANTWGKLIQREILEKAYDNIPYTECNLADDALVFFFLSQNAKKYIGIKNKVYRYRVNTGMTSAKKIDTLHKWKMTCSSASVFSILNTWIEEQKNNPTSKMLLPEEVEKIHELTRLYLHNNLMQLQQRVIPELQPAAREMLCEYWGESFVNRIEKYIEKSQSE